MTSKGLQRSPKQLLCIYSYVDRTHGSFQEYCLIPVKGAGFLNVQQMLDPLKSCQPACWSTWGWPNAWQHLSCSQILTQCWSVTSCWHDRQHPTHRHTCWSLETRLMIVIIWWWHKRVLSNRLTSSCVSVQLVPLLTLCPYLQAWTWTECCIDAGREGGTWGRHSPCTSVGKFGSHSNLVCAASSEKTCSAFPRRRTGNQACRGESASPGRLSSLFALVWKDALQSRDLGSLGREIIGATPQT